MHVEPTASADLVADLNTAQREAACAPAGPLLVLAGAGSGKTRVLTRRIAWLIRTNGVAPEGILAVTFTNKAAGEMRERIEHLLGRSVRGLWIGTFHSICLRWLRRHARAAGYGPQVSVFDAEDQLGLLRRLLKEEGYDHTPRRARELQSIISRAKNRAQDPEELSGQARTPAQILAARLYTAYQEALRRQSAADFDDLLLGAYRLFRDHPAIADGYAAQFEHILVDEYQDTNRVQFLLVERLARAHRNILVVGDDDQSIYGWRGADVRNILDFKKQFPDARVFYLEQNYRSTQPILSFANALIARNSGRWEKQLWTARAGGEPPEFFLAADEDDEAEQIARRAMSAHQQAGRPYREMAIFYRTHAQSRPIEDAFLRRGIPYVIVGGIYFYARREVKDVLSYLRVLVNPRDETSLRRALAVPRRGIGEQSREVFLERVRAAEADALEAARAGGETAGLSRRAQAALQAFGAWMVPLRARLVEPPERILSEIVAASGYRDSLREEGGDWEERLANVDELLESARLFSSREEGGAGEYLDQVSLLTSMDTALEAGADAVTLMTAHNAKGLEFPQVFVTGLEEGLFPHASSLDDKSELEEERRLFYVACTRAMDRLTLSASQMRRRYSSGAGGVSRFLGEVDPELFRDTSEDLTGAAFAPTYERRTAGRRVPGGSRGPRVSDDPSGAGHADGQEHPWIGRRVYHASFGQGLVTAVEGQGDRARITVRFHSGQTRKVLKGYLEWDV
ncbi:MAG: UvrD-helicase domain-containing protein [Candidatus Eisenbacteria bacterium]